MLQLACSCKKRGYTLGSLFMVCQFTFGASIQSIPVVASILQGGVHMQRPCFGTHSHAVKLQQHSNTMLHRL
jgi:hypothetical protein